MGYGIFQRSHQTRYRVEKSLIFAIVFTEIWDTKAKNSRDVGNSDLPGPCWGLTAYEIVNPTHLFAKASQTICSLAKETPITIAHAFIEIETHTTRFSWSTWLAA